LTLLVAAAVCLSALHWVGGTFPGFLVLENRVIASAGLAHWPAAQSGEIYQHEVLSVNGDRLTRASDLAERVRANAPGEPVHYVLRRAGRSIEWTEPTRVFTWMDFALLHGTLLFCGIGLTGIGLAIRFLRCSDRVANGTSLALWIVGMYALTAVDLYGPYRFFRLHALFECLLFAGALHIALIFPQPLRLLDRMPWILHASYGAAFVLAARLQIGLYDPATYVAIHRIAVDGFALALVVFITTQVWTYLRPPSFEARQRVKVVVLGTVAALSPQVVIIFFSARSGGQVPENLMALSGIFFPISLGYAVLRQDLFGVDAILRRSLNYALLTALIAAGYAGAFAAFEAVYQGQNARGVFAIVLGVVSVMVLLPLRDRVQHAVDRLFFRSAYDFRRLVETTSAGLASVTNVAVIAEGLQRALREALQPEWIALDVRKTPDAPLARAVAGDAAPPLDPVIAARAETLTSPFEIEGDGLAVPFRVQGKLVALLRLGRRLSGRYYGGDDRRLLQTLANQGAVAIENGLAIERLSELNRDLEAMVEERTSELLRANHELRETQSHLVQQEKMASIGQLVAGVAHEINNPVNFIQGNVHFLREHTDALVAALRAVEAVASNPTLDLPAELERIREEYELDYVLGDLPGVFESCDEGVERTTTVVRDLRTFSRHDEAECQSVNLSESLESTLGLLRSRLTGIRVEREYDDLPLVECLAGQMGQVFLNLLTNAADAVGDSGTIRVRARTMDADRVCVEVEDDGCGIAPDQLDRIFDPFFTTKEVGKGTGLGLSITYGIVYRHGGRIEVASAPGEGTCFRVELPVCFTAPDAHSERPKDR
jgi:signal transduction histidine kinase